MPRRSKPKAIETIADLKQAEQALAELAGLDRDLKAIESGLNEGVDQLKVEAKSKAEPLAARRKELETGLATFAQMNKAELFTKPKSRELTFGTIGFRKTTKLLTQPKLTLAMVLEKIKAYGFTEAVRCKENVDKDAMRDWPDERLALVGVKRQSGDEFFIELKTEEIGE
jgi:phage host-nuclease inhibitor protein Gam